MNRTETFADYEEFIYLNSHMTRDEARNAARRYWNEGVDKREALNACTVTKANGNEANEYTFRLIDGDFFEGETVTVETVLDGRQFTRKVRSDSWDLYIMLKGSKAYWECDRVEA